MNKQFYETNLFVVLVLIIFFPLGLYLMFKRKCFNKPVRIAIASVFAIITVASVLNQPVSQNNTENNKAQETAAESNIATDNNTQEKIEEETKPLTITEIVNKVGKDSVLEVNTGEDLVVKMKFPSTFSNSMSVTSAFLKAKDIIQHSLDNGYEFNTYQFWFTADLADVYGNTENYKVLSFEYDRSTIEKINFNGITNDNFEKLATNVYKHPAITK